MKKAIIAAMLIAGMAAIAQAATYPDGKRINQNAPFDVLSAANVKINDAVNLAGKATPGSTISVYFFCSDGCGATKVGDVKVDQDGNYSLIFKVPSNAKPGSAYVVAGSNKNGTGWSKINGIMVNEHPETTVTRAHTSELNCNPGPSS